MMKKTILAAVVLAASGSVSANGVYVEGGLGYYDADVSTKSYSGSSGGITWTNLKADFDYDNDVALGLELGMSVTDNVRVGLSYAKTSFDLESATVSGSATDGTTTISGSAPVTRDDVSSLGLSWDNDVDLLMVNAYYDFGQMNGLTPFLGVGIGQADIQNAKDDETALSISLGAKYDINPNTYVGGKFVYYKIDGPTDTLDIVYEDIDVTSLQLLVGYKF
jgi:opacity protein-like surface antigen